MWSKISNTIKATATAVADETSRAYNEAKATPTQMLCAGCNTLLLVPDTSFDWKCETGHTNKNTFDKCQAETCAGLKPKNRTEPLIRCASCNTVTPVPFTNAEKSLRETGRSIKSSVEHMKSKPTTFNCTNCDNLLMVPTGPWVCQTCTNVNPQDVEKCTSCVQRKADQKVMCGICKRSTQVPSMNIVNSISKGWRDVTKGTHKIYYDLAKSPYVTCPRCSTNIAIPTTAPPTTTTTTTTTTSSSDVKVPTQEKKGAESPPAEDVEPGSTSSSGVSAPTFRTLHCPSCGMTLNYIPPPPTMPTSETTTAPTSDIVTARRRSSTTSGSSASTSSGSSGSYSTSSEGASSSSTVSSSSS